MIIIQKNTDPLQGVAFEKGILKFYGDIDLGGEPLKDLFSILYDHFTPRKQELLQIIKSKLKKELFFIDKDGLNDGNNKVEYEIEFDQGLVRLELMIYFKNTSTPYTEDHSYMIELTSVKSFEFYDCFGKRKYMDISLDDIYDLIVDGINTSVY